MDLPNGWDYITIGEMATYINGRAFKPAEWEESGLPIIRIQNLNNENTKYNYSSKEYEEKYKIVFGDLLFAWSASLGAYIWRNGEAWLNQHIFKVAPHNGIHKKFMYYTLVNTIAYFYSQAHGSGMVHITKGPFEATKTPLPPLAEQHRIVAKIDALFSELDKGVETLQTIRQQLRMYRQAVLKWAFEGKLTDSIDECINIVPMRDIVFQYQNGISKRSGNEGIKYKVLRLSDIENFKIFDKSPRFIDLTESEIEKYTLLPNDLVLIRVNGSRELVGRLIIITYEQKWAYCDHFIRIRLKSETAYSPYIRYLFDSKIIRDFVSYKMVSTAGQNTISQASINELNLPLPPLDIQKRIVTEIESRLSVCDKLEQLVDENLYKAQALKQSIFKKAFAGQLVPQDLNDEPASILLERIKAEQERSAAMIKTKRRQEKWLNKTHQRL